MAARSLLTFLQVWNYKQKRCLFTLLGHLDYIRTTFFHKVRSSVSCAFVLLGYLINAVMTGATPILNPHSL